MSPTWGDEMILLATFCTLFLHIKSNAFPEYLYSRLAVGKNQTSKNKTTLCVVLICEPSTFVDPSRKVVPAPEICLHNLHYKGILFILHVETAPQGHGGASAFGQSFYSQESLALSVHKNSNCDFQK